MILSATAPGKMVVVGEYAVLEGAPAIVVGLQRRACARMETSHDGSLCVDAPDLGLHQVSGHMEGGRLHWQADGTTADRLKLVSAVLEQLAAQGCLVEPLNLSLDSSAFFTTGDRGRAKLGLGSSAALTVALAGGVHALNDRAAPQLTDLIAMHRRMQGGRGSGLDVATSLLGGTLVYRLDDGQPRATHTQWPAQLGLCCVWSGRSASTGDALARLAAWRQQHARAYALSMDELSDTSRIATRALKDNNAATFMDSLTIYSDHLSRLGEASGIDIVCAEHRALARLASSCGAAYKSCGAGGGDIGMAVATDPDCLARFSQRAKSAGFRILEAGIDPRGLSVQAASHVKGDHHGSRTYDRI